MATLEELLTEDGFEMRRHKHMQGTRRGPAGSGAARLRNPRLGHSVSEIQAVRTRSNVSPRRSLSALKEKGETRASNSGDRRHIRSLQEVDRRALCSLKESMGFEGRFDKNYRCGPAIEGHDVNSKLFLAVESRNDTFDKGQAKLGYASVENKRREGRKAQHLQVKPSFKDTVNVCPEMEEGSLKTAIFMMNNCVNQLIEDESFRLSLHQACVSSLKSSLVQDKLAEVNGAIYTLKEAIGAVERILTQGPDLREQKKTSFKLSVITGLKSVELDDGQTCGIPNSHLAACGHLYLSILYKIQKKDKLSAKHLLQFFCDSPYQARTALLPELWDQLFLRSLSHLKAWYDKEVESIPVTSRMMMKLEFLEKIYNDIVDLGTAQIAAYYKAWLMEERGPAFPSIPIPFVPVPDMVDDDDEVVSCESYSSSSSAPTMISKSLYESVLGQGNKQEITYEVESEKEEEKDKVGDETGEGKLNTWRSRYDNAMQKDNESQYYTAENSFEYYSTGFQNSITFSEENDQAKENYSWSSSSGILETGGIKLGGEVVRFSQDIKEYFSVDKCDSQENENQFKLKKLAQDAFQCKMTDQSTEMTRIACAKLATDKTNTTKGLGSRCMNKKSRDILSGDYEKNDQSSYSRIPKEFICPLTGQLLKDPVTLASGYTFELAAIQDQFTQGNITCPITGQSLRSSPFPDINAVLKHMINQWMEECFRKSISLASQSTFRPQQEAYNSNFELPILIIRQFLTGFSSKEVKENIKLLISLGGLQFLIHLVEFGSLEDKSCAAKFLVQCIQANGHYRNHIAMNINKSSLLELIHSKEVHARACAASLLIELICLNRRMDITSFVSGLKTEDIDNTRHELLMHLVGSPPEERVLVAVLLLYIDCTEESSKAKSVYKKEAVKCITWALECCHSNKKFIRNCKRALFMLGGHFSYSGEVLIETWLLKKSGYYCEASSYTDEDDETISEEESRRREDWLRSISTVLLCYGNKSFLAALFKCWKSESQDLVRTCVVTTAWLCHALPSLQVPALQRSAFSTLLPRLKECLESDPNVENRVLASFSLLNFSKILECRVPLISVADEIHDSLKSLVEVTWTAKCVYNDIF